MVDAARLQKGELARHVAADLARSFARLLVRRVRRDQQQVADDYDQGVWKRALEERAWEQATDLEAYVIGTNRAEALVKVGGAVFRMERAAYNRVRLQGLQEAIRESMEDQVIELVELGCGAGYNVFSLALDPRWKRITGLDISPNGVAVARSVASNFGRGDLSFGLIDITDPENPSWSLLEGRSVFTYLCLEQLPSQIEQVITHLLAARPRRVVHIESSVDLLRPWRPLDIANLVYLRSMDYQRSLMHVLAAKEREGRLRILGARSLQFAPTIHHDAALIVWEPAD